MNTVAGRNRSLDGLRGVAVLLVLLHHHGYLNSGWLGVDLFFVLSGYLITSMLRETRDDAHFWREFWLKRATRILPPLVLLLVISELLFRLSPLEMWGYFFSLGDILAYTKPFHPLDPLWSLAVEEHFYFLWPFAVRSLTRRTLCFLLASLVVAEPLLRALVSLSISGWEFTYYLTPFRLDGLCFGCILALCLESPTSREWIARWSLPGLLVAGSLWAGLRMAWGDHFTRTYPGPGYNSCAYLIIAFGAFALISYLVTSPGSVLAALLSWRALTFCGSISYGLYLYQLVIRELVTKTYHLAPKRAFYIDLPLTFAIAWLSYQFYERPFIVWGRKRAQQLRNRQHVNSGLPNIQHVPEEA